MDNDHFSERRKNKLYSGWFMETIMWAQNDRRNNNTSCNQTISDGLNDFKATVNDYLLMNHFILYEKSIDGL